ncbi:MAG TPA: ATP phosphoribosyltransferase regulatory subunit, partial [Thermoanaerobaculia bacterium]|nr:ATP phosphoribosyltransferase regulatory subunit [Thermoanaerobaculia bacterium]
PPCLLGDEPASGDVLLAVAERGVPERPDDLGADGAERLAAVLALRDELAAAHSEVALTVDLAEFAGHTLAPALAPALAAAGEGSYYDGLVFRVYAGDSALPAGAGGRYDRLFRRLGAEVPAVGFSLALDRLAGGSRARVPLAVVGASPVPRRGEPAR